MRLGASTRFLSQAQQRTRIHSPLVTIRQNAMFSLNSFVFMKKSFLLLSLLWGALSAWAHDAEVDGIFYDLNNTNKTATVTFRGDSYDAYEYEYAGDVVIPKAVTYNGITYSVTNLGKECFRGCSDLTSITIPNSVKRLGVSCFKDCEGLTSITIPNSVTSLRDYCFEDCKGLTSITIPNSVTSLGESCFNRCKSLTSVTIPNSVTSLGDWCFSNCSRLTSITIPNSVTNLDGTFAGCSSLTSITIPNSVTSLGNSCFYGCSSLTSLTIPNSVTSLGGGCFNGCSSLTSITIPNSVRSLGYNCFEGCSSLISIYMLPSTPPSIDSYIFYKTPLKTIYVVNENAKKAYQAQGYWNNFAIVVKRTGIK